MNDDKKNIKDTGNGPGLIQKDHITIIAGPCAIESRQQLEKTAKIVSDLIPSA
jgi:3-deoxy-D-arabino-heptulosonate 7-phosphate (DAHP) synthase